MSKGTPALVTQLDLIEWLRGETAKHWGEWLLSGTPGANSLRGRGGNEIMGPALSEMMNKAETVFVSRDMCTIIEAAAETLPDIPLQPEQVFWSSAFIYFERPIRHALPMTPADGFVIDTRAIFMGSGPVMDGDAANEAAEAAGLKNYTELPEEQQVTFAKKGLTHVTFVDIDVAFKAIGRSSAELGIRVFPFDMSGWVYGKSWETVEHKLRPGFTGAEVDPGLAQQRKLLLATLLIAQQYVAVRRSTRATRQVRRRVARMDAVSPNFGDITYITLRRNSASVEEDRETTDEWGGYSHRFPVKGYWKHQWYPSKQEHHLIWVEPYIKGPPDKPLIIRDKVYKLVR